MCVYVWKKIDYFVFDLCFLFNSWWLCFDSAQLSPPDVPNDPCKSNCTWCFYLCWNVSRVIEYRAFVQKHDKIFGRKDACLYVFFFSVNEARHSHSTKTITTQRMKMKQNKSAKIRWVLFFNVIFLKHFCQIFCTYLTLSLPTFVLQPTYFNSQF